MQIQDNKMPGIRHLLNTTSTQEPREPGSKLLQMGAQDPNMLHTRLLLLLLLLQMGVQDPNMLQIKLLLIQMWVQDPNRHHTLRLLTQM
jgi:hypothetical protein